MNFQSAKASKESSMSSKTIVVSLAAMALFLASCTNIDIDNRPPGADIQLVANVSDTGAVMYSGSPVTVELDGSGSTDPDGDSITYRGSLVKRVADLLVFQ